MQTSVIKKNWWRYNDVFILAWRGQYFTWYNGGYDSKMLFVKIALVQEQ